MKRFTHKVCNLRTPDWAGHVDERYLREWMQADAREGRPWRIVPWMINPSTPISRSYLLLGPDGGLYAVFFRRADL